MNIDLRGLPSHSLGSGYPFTSVPASIFGAALVGLTLLTISGCAPSETERPEIVRPVKTMLIMPGENTSTRAFPGRVDASQRVQLAFQVSGLLVPLPAREGQEVAKGEVIAQLREDEFKARLTAL